MTRWRKIVRKRGPMVVSMVFVFLHTALAATFQIRVLNAKNGERIVGQKVSVLVKGEKGATEYKTDGEGNITVDVPANAEVFVATEWWVTCRRAGKGLDPYVPVEKIVEEGVTVENSCGRAKSETIRGKLIIFARKASLFELFRK